VVDLAAEYVLLAARAGRLLPGVADVPPAIRRRAAAEPPPRASDLVRATGRLALAVPGADLDARRARFLTAQLQALECTARRLAGQEVAFAREIADTFGVRIRPGCTDDYRRAHARLADLLPGPGPLAERVAQHRRSDEVPPALLLPALRALSQALRRRTPWLVAGEHATYRLIPDAPWSALHTGLGGGRSVVTVNLAARPRWGQLPALVAHEAYPGHHVQRCRAEAGALPELAAVLVRSPQSVVAEGAAEEGLGVLVGPGWGAWARDILAEVGARFDAELAERLDEVGRALRPVRQDAALLLHGPRPRPDAAVEHVRRWLLVDGARARRIVAALASPLWRGHVVADVEGSRMVSSWLRAGTDSPIQRYARLLDEPLVPVDLLPEGGEPPERRAAVRVTGDAVSRASG